MKVAAIVLILAIALLLWPDPFARLIWRKRIPDLDQAGNKILPRGCEARSARGFCRIVGKPNGITAAACTIGKTVLVNPDLPRPKMIATLKHERGHCNDALHDGPLYVPRYLWRWARVGFRYHAHPDEIRANAQEEE